MVIDSGADCFQIERKVEKVIKIGESRGIIVEDYQILNIATHNINGIKGNAIKVEILLEWARQEKIDIIGINETNMTERQNKFSMNRQVDYVGIWADAEENKKKGSGVGLIMNKKWEKHLSQVKRNKKLPLLNWLGNSDMVDTFRKLHPYEKKFTRSNDQVKSRIDYIWTSKDLGQGLISCKIMDSDTITNSDHAIVSASIATGIMKKSRTAACDKRLKGKKWVFNLDKATEENWGDYKAKLDNILKEKLVSKKGKKKDNSTRLEAISKDELWDLISISIIKCARATLPGKKIILGKTSPKKKKNVSDIMKRELKKIGKMCQQCVAGMGQQISDMNRTNINLQITNLNNTYETKIEELSETVWSKKRLENLKIWWKII